MLEKPTLRSTWLPLALLALALLILNGGLYLRLSSQPAAAAAPTSSTLALPYNVDYTAADADSNYLPFGGDWEIRDETLVQLSTTGFDLGTLIPLNIPPDQPYSFSASLQNLSSSNGGGGILFNAQQTTSRQQSHMARFNVDAGRVWLIYGYYGDNSDFVGQGSAPLNITIEDSAAHTLGAQVVADTYSLLFDSQVVAAGIPLQYRGGSVGLVASASQVAFDDIHAEALSAEASAEIAAQAAFAAPPQSPTTITDAADGALIRDAFDAESAGESLWLPFGGQWQYEDGSFVQVQPEGFDLGTGYQQRVEAPYTLRVTLQHRTGAGGGILFNMSQPDSKNGAYMVRYVENGDFVAWGYFDETGAFQGQGSAAVPLPGTDTHTFEVSVGTGAYAIRVDDVSLVDNAAFPEPMTGGYVGLVAAQSVVAFNNVEVFANQSAAAAEQTTEPPTSATDANTNITQGMDFNTSSGVWAVNEADNVITQSAAENTDYLVSTGIAAENFTVSADILLPAENADAGAGLIFHMPERSAAAGGQMIRFGSGGSEIFWGLYDEAGAFQGQGSAPLTLEAGTPHTLTLVVRDSDFDVLVDGQMVAAVQPSQGRSGWIGLISFGGPVEFSNIQLRLGEQ